ncbi:uncharacterized protein LOC135466800 isoform X2 [Liolophura sinensis]
MSASAPDVLYTNDNDTHDHGLILLVDQRESGGDVVGLGQLCKMFEDVGIKYRTEILDCGDYQWKWRCDQEEITLPVVIERKRADDLAASLKDGRFWKQINNMLKWQERARKQALVGPLHYIIEGELEKYVVQCEDGCQGVGRCGHPPLSAVQAAVKDLECHPSLCVHKTDSLLNTVNLLAIFSADIGKRIFDGEFDRLRRACCTEMNGNSSNMTHSGLSGDTYIKPGTVCKNDDADDTTVGNYCNNSESTTIKDLPSCNTGNDDDDDGVILISYEIPDTKHVQHNSTGYSNNNNNSNPCSSPLVEVKPICGQTHKLSVSTDVYTSHGAGSLSSVKRKLEDSWSISPSKSTPGGKVYLMKTGYKQKSGSD